MRSLKCNIGGDKFFAALGLVILLIDQSAAGGQLTPKGEIGEKWNPPVLKNRPPGKRQMTRIKLADAATGKPLAHLPVQISSNNGIRCKKAPCPTNEKQWLGTTDAAGVLALPSDVIQFDTYIFAGRYSGRISLSKTKNPMATRIVKLSRVIFEDARLFQKHGKTGFSSNKLFCRV